MWQNMNPAVIASVETMLEKWKGREGDEIEVFNEFRLLTSEVISRTAFGSNYWEGKKIFEMLTKLAILVSRNYFKTPIPGIRYLPPFFRFQFLFHRNEFDFNSLYSYNF